MINESQKQLLLSECESQLGKRLGRLRASLQKDKATQEAHLWELIVLYEILSLKKQYAQLKNTSSIEIVPESADGTPDVALRLDDQSFWVEAAYVMPRESDSEVIHFIHWVREQLNKRGVAFASSLRISLEPKLADTHQAIEVPPRKRWETLLNQESWNLFVEEVVSSNFPSCWILRDSNLVVKAEGVEQGQYVSASFPALGVPEQATDNLIYRTIGKKSEQARKWERAGGNYQPLVLVIGASKGLHRMSAENQFSLRQLEKAVYSALADVKQWSWTTILNLTDNRSFPSELYSQQVDGSDLISAVVIVTIRNEPAGWNRWTERASRPIIIKNPHPKIALTAEQEQFLARLDFNHVDYELS